VITPLQIIYQVHSTERMRQILCLVKYFLEKIFPQPSVTVRHTIFGKYQFDHARSAQNYVDHLVTLCFVRMTRKYYLISCLLYAPQSALSYLVMLASMSYNTWVFVSIIAGSVVGNWAFSWRSVGIKKKCHH